MKVYQFPATITPEGNLDLPDNLVKLLPDDQPVQVIILVNEATDSEEDEDWSRLATQQLLAQYDEADAIYDHL